MKTAIDDAGRMVIPKAVREAAGLRPGEPLKVTYRDGRIEIEPEAAEMKLVRKGKLTVARMPGASPLTHEQVNRVLGEVRRRET